MTTPTPHGTMPELPEIPPSDCIPYDAIRYIAGYPASYVQRYATEYAKLCLARAAIQQAAGAVPEGYAQRVIDELYENGDPVSVDAAELITQMLAASPSPLGREAGKEGSSDHLVPCAGGGVTLPLTDERLLVSFLRNTTVFHQSDTPEWLYARDGDGNSASIRASEIVSAIRNIIKEHS